MAAMKFGWLSLAGLLWAGVAAAQCPSPGCPSPNYDAMTVGSPTGGAQAGYVNASKGFLLQGVPILGTGFVQGPSSSTDGYVPTWTGLTGTLLGTGIAIGTSGATIPLNNGGFTQSGTAAFSSTLSATGGGTLSGSFAMGSFTGTGTPTFGTVNLATIAAPSTTLTLNTGNTTGTIKTVNAAFYAQSFPITSTISGLQDHTFMDFNIGVNAANTGAIVTGLGVQMNLAPNNGQTASGGYEAFNANLTQGTLGGTGTYTCGGCINSIAVFNYTNNVNTGGTSTLSLNATNGINVVMKDTTGGTYSNGHSIFEGDNSAGVQVDSENGILMVSLGGDSVVPRLGRSAAYSISSAATAANGWGRALQIGVPHSYWPLPGHYGFGIFASPLTQSPSPDMASLIVASGVAMHACTIKVGYIAICPMAASGITGATRLTTDGSGSAIGFIENAIVTSTGSGYSAYPTPITVTGCSGANLQAEMGGTNQSVVGALWVNTQPTNCEAEATVSLGGSATANLVITGNSLNLPINSTDSIQCHIPGVDGSGHNITFVSDFTATVGATSNTTAINPSAIVTGTIATTTLTVSAVTSGTLHVGDQISGASVTSGSYITALGTGAGGAGTYTLSASSSVGSGETITATPGWQIASANAGAPAAITMSPPAADTTLGAINLTATPSSGTWNLGGSCVISSTSMSI